MVVNFILFSFGNGENIIITDFFFQSRKREERMSEFIKLFYIGFPGQIRKFDNQIHFNFIQIRQILSCRENYHSNSFSYHSI